MTAKCLTFTVATGHGQTHSGCGDQTVEPTDATGEAMLA